MTYLTIKDLATDYSLKIPTAIPLKLKSALDVAFKSESNDSLAITDFIITDFASEEERKRYEAIREVLNTEKKYLDDLIIIIEVSCLI